MSQDYEGTGKADPTVYRPSSSTFSKLPASGPQQNIQFGAGNLDVAAAGPLLYRLSALRSPYATTDGYPASALKGVGTGQGQAVGPGMTLRALAIAPPIPLPAPSTPPAVPSPSIPIGEPTSGIPAASVSALAPAPAPTVAVIVGSATPTVSIPSDVPSGPALVGHRRPAGHHARPRGKPAPSSHLAVEVKAHHPVPAPTADQHHAAVAAAIRHVGPIRKGRRDA